MSGMSEPSSEPLDFAKLLRRSKLGPVFTAAFDTRNGCNECLEDIFEGEDVRYDDGELKHADCVAELVPDD